MKISCYGSNSWLLDEGGSKLFINPTLGTVKLGLRNELVYRGVPLSFEWPTDCFLQAVTSDQYQFFDPAVVSKHKVPTLVPLTSVLPILDPLRYHVLPWGQASEYGNFTITYFGSKYPSSFWDNSGASILVEGKISGRRFFLQGSNSLNFSKSDNFPKSLDISILTWNTFSTISPISAYANLYNVDEFFTIKDDVENFIKYLSQAPVSRLVSLQGSEFSSGLYNTFRRSLSDSMDFLAPYMVGTELIDIKPGMSLDLQDGSKTNFPPEKRGFLEFSERVSNYELSLTTEETDLFFHSLSEIFLLTLFGKEVFGCSRVGEKLTSSQRFCFIIFGSEGSSSCYVFDISTCSFIKYGGISVEEARKTFPFGLTIEMTDLAAIEFGKVDPWPILNSERFSQWYLCEPKNAPSTLLFQLWSELRTKRRFLNYCAEH